MKDNYGIIYCATNVINNKRYIGQTIRNLNRRKKEHISQADNGSNYAFHLAINKYGADKFEWSTIDVADSQEELDEKESYWIDYYDCFKTGGYNMSTGGQFGKKTDNNADDLSVMNGGREFLVFDIEGNFEKICISQTKFAEEIGSCVQSVNNILRGKKNKHSVKEKILFFKDGFTEDKLRDRLIIINNIHREFVLFDKNNNYIGVWSNQTRCSEEIDISTRGIQRQLNENPLQRTFRKYKIYYIEDVPENLKYLIKEMI